MMDRDQRIRNLLRSVRNFVVFFLVVAFAVTCCMLLFVQSLSRAMGIVFTEADIQTAAKLTMGNVVLLSLLFACIDRIRRRFMVDRPVKRITEAAERLMHGDFSVRIKPFRESDAMLGFNTVIDCFNRMASELAGTETLRTDFIANVSHELKTPLAVMQNYAVMLQSPGLPEAERIAYAKAVSDACRRLASLITNILKLNKLENQQLHPMQETFDLGEQLCECLLAFEDAWEAKALSIDTSLVDGVTVRSDRELLSLIWNNLFSNAVKFTPAGGAVTLTLSADADTAVVSVTDTGCGISPDVGRHMFEKFYQGDTSHATEGNGLGLALVKRVVDIIGGDISVESEPGRGSTFTVRLKRGVSDVVA